MPDCTMARKPSRWRPDRWVIFALAGAVLYGSLAFPRLAEFPPYFFCDEAVVGVEARNLLETGRDRFGILFPAFFRSLGQYEQSAAVYLEIPSVFAFGLNEFAVRFTMAVIGCLGVAVSFFLLRNFFIGNGAWLVFPAFLFSPFWFLHVRTGFQVVPATVFLTAFVFCYLTAFRKGSVRWIVLATLAAALSFYCYIPARGWVLLSLLLFLLGNPKESWRQRKMLACGGIVLLAFLIPYLLFQIRHPDLALSRLNSTGWAGFWSHEWDWRIDHLFGNYLKAYNPLSWFTVDSMMRIVELDRHLIPGLPQIPVVLAPFFAVGLILTFARIRRMEYRVLLAILLAAPAPSSFSVFNTLRGMPVGIVFVWISVIGLGWLLSSLARWPRLVLGTHTLLLGIAVAYAPFFHHHVFEVSPKAYRDYGFFGLQYGAPQVFGWARENVAGHDRILISHNLFNAGEIFRHFYLPKDQRAKLQIFEDSSICRRPREVLHEKAAILVRSSFFDEVRQLRCPIEIRILKEFRDPSGSPQFAAFEYAPKAGFKAWKRKREIEMRSLRDDKAVVGGRELKVRHSPFDMGKIGSLLDGNPATFVRSEGVNPLLVQFELPNLPVRKVDVTVRHNPSFAVRVRTRGAEGVRDWPSQTTTLLEGTTRTLTFAPPVPLTKVRSLEIEVRDDKTGPDQFVHLADLSWE